MIGEGYDGVCRPLGVCTGGPRAAGSGAQRPRCSRMLRDGKVLERHVPHALGSLERPMSDADLEAKLWALVEPVLGKAQTEKVIEQCWDAEKLDDAGVIARASAQPPAS